MDEHTRANLAHWNEMVAINANSELYALDEFKAGATRLGPIERREVGDVASKSLLHLQCHFGMDTLSWARLGATVTGIDLSDKAIELARSLAAELRIPARFVCTPLYDAPAALDGRFDIVFTSWGVICWLQDLRRWADVIAHFLKPGGFFYIIDQHPFARIFYAEQDATRLVLETSYFHTDALIWPTGPAYSNPAVTFKNPEHDFLHTIESICGSLLDAGLKIDFIHEFPACAWKAFPFAEQDADGMWRIKGDPIPLSFSLKASKA